MNVDDAVKGPEAMYPRLLEEIARDRTETLRSQARQRSGATVSRRRSGGIRRHTGWTLVMIGLRIAESAGR
jgi:hypothetical protein